MKKKKNKSIQGGSTMKLNDLKNKKFIILTIFILLTLFIVYHYGLYIQNKDIIPIDSKPKLRKFIINGGLNNELDGSDCRKCLGGSLFYSVYELEDGFMVKWFGCHLCKLNDPATFIHYNGSSSLGYVEANFFGKVKRAVVINSDEKETWLVINEN